MWQVLLAAAAAAGSGILAKKFISPTDTENPISDFKQNDCECDQNRYMHPKDSIFPCDDAIRENNSQEMREANGDGDKIFRFSSHETESKELRKRIGSGFGGPDKNGGKVKGKKRWLVEGGEKGSVVKQRGNESGKRISVCLKKRRTGKHAAGKCESCASKDNSFGWGVGVGMMYMMSAEKAEIGRLNCAMDETAKTVQELKAEILRTRSSHSENESETKNKHIERNYSDPVVFVPDTKGRANIKTFGSSLTEEGECASSVLTEEQQQLEVLKMDQLEAELESELQKLPWCATEGSGSGRRTDVFEAEGFAIEDFQNSNSLRCGGVSPAELDQKLCHLLIEKQENQIMEFEAELQRTNSKLQEKEAELQALKECVKRLTEFSLASVSDEDTEGHEDDKRSYGDEEMIGPESRKSIVGMKRGVGFESYVCSNK